tara:strand:- start:661 stop:1101 length:441 start_codon:yes stop_codon:yes gene_type:complete
MIRAIIKRRPKIKMRNKKIAQMLNDIANIAVSQIKSDMDKGRDIEGKKFAPLKDSTVESKKKKGSKYPRRPLIDTGLMQKVFRSKSASASSLVSEVSTAKKRKEVAIYHNEGAGKLPERKWFGVGKKTKRRFDKYIKSRIRGVLKP